MVSLEQIYLNFSQESTLTEVLSYGVMVFFLQLEKYNLEGDFRNWFGQIGSNVGYVGHLNYSRYIYVLMTTVSKPILKIKSYRIKCGRAPELESRLNSLEVC